MLPGFMRRNGKKNGRKHLRVCGSMRNNQPPLSPESFEPPEILDINERSIYAPPIGSTSPLMQVEISTEPWFPEELLRSRRSSKRSSASVGYAGATRSTVAQAHGDVQDPSSSRGSPKPSVNLMKSYEHFPARKFVPAPIIIPQPQVRVSVTQEATSRASIKPPDPSMKDLPTVPSPAGSTENTSAVSGTTLARALIANSFILSSDERVHSLPRSSVSRQDSATLPRELPVPCLVATGEETRRISSVLHMPPASHNAPLDQKRSRVSPGITGMRPLGTGLEPSDESPSPGYPWSESQYSTSPEIALHSGQRRRISRISEVPSAPSTPMSLKIALESQQKPAKSTTMGMTSGAFADITESDVPCSTASDMVSTPPTSCKPSWDMGNSSMDACSSPADHSLDEYSFVSPGPQTAMFSPGSDSSASYVAPLPVRRSNNSLRRRYTKTTGGASSRGMLFPAILLKHSKVKSIGLEARAKTPYQRNKKQVRLLPVRESFAHQIPFTPAMMASSIPHTSLSQLPLVPSSAVSAGHLEIPLTAYEGNDLDYSELLDYTITVSPDPSSSSRYTSNSSAGYQTFPETPMFSPPLFSADCLLPPAPTLRNKRPAHLRSATLPSPRDYAAKGMQTRSLSTEAISPSGLEDEDITSTRRPQSAASAIQATTLPLLEPATNHWPPSSVSGPGTVRSPTMFPASGGLVSTSDSDEPTPALVMLSASSTSSTRPQDSASQGPSTSSTSLTSPPVTTTASSTPLTSPPCIMTTPSTPLTSPPCTTINCLSPAAVPLPNSTDGSPRLPSSPDNLASSSPAVLSSRLSSSSPTGPPSIVSQPQPTRASDIAASPVFGASFLPSLAPSPSPPVSPGTTPARTSSPLLPPQPLVQPSRPSSTFSLSASFVAPPPYHSVVSEVRQGGPPGDGNHPVLQTHSSPPRDRGIESSPSVSSTQSHSTPSRARQRPRLPLGPRRPSGPAQPLGAFVPGFRERGASAPTLADIDSSYSTWDKLYEAASKPLPKFQAPRPKWRGLTMEAAQWTLTATQLQGIVSRAIKQSTEGSAIRLLRLDTLDGEIAEEEHRLDLLRTDIKSRYKALVRKRWELLGTLAGHLQNGTACQAAASTLEELAKVTSAQDELADELYVVGEQIAQVKSLRDVHHGSALTMALRKVNAAFLRQSAEVQKLREQVEVLEAERDEGWKQAQDIALEYDRMVDASGESCTKTSNRRSARVSAVRKSSIRQSKAGLRPISTSRRRSGSSAGSRGSTSIPSSACKEDVPPVPPLLLHPFDPATAAMTSGSY
ncbi:hypothetical protein ID866_2432 [Astraeus odoratus]|nr:hypothetical protein ID866_2432 [Astraeus odoratus]